MFTAKDREEVGAIQKDAWKSPEEFRQLLIANKRSDGVEVQLKGKGERNRYAIIHEVNVNEVTLRYTDGEVLKVPMSRIAGFTTNTDWYRQRKR